jgi:rhodanese-related sulfurtransferase
MGIITTAGKKDSARGEENIMSDKYTITAAEFAAKYKAGELDEAYIMDVREPYEWEAGHLDKANHVPMNTVPERLEELDKAKTMYIVCAHGVRSGHVTQYLLGNGFNNVVNVEGGMAEIIHYLK